MPSTVDELYPALVGFRSIGVPAAVQYTPRKYKAWLITPADANPPRSPMPDALTPIGLGPGPLVPAGACQRVEIHGGVPRAYPRTQDEA